jgi:hypothetical protein
MSRAAVIAAVAAALVLVAGCGTTTIIANDRNARIYVNGVMVGKGTAEVRQRGMPSSSSVVVKTADGRESSTRMKRRFTGTTFVIGLFTYATGWLLAWEYPDAVFVEVEPAEEAPAGPGWGDGGGGDAWSRPPPGWEPAPESPLPPPPPPPGP